MKLTKYYLLSKIKVMIISGLLLKKAKKKTDHPKQVEKTYESYNKGYGKRKDNYYNEESYNTRGNYRGRGGNRRGGPRTNKNTRTQYSKNPQKVESNTNPETNTNNEINQPSTFPSSSNQNPSETLISSQQEAREIQDLGKNIQNQLNLNLIDKEKEDQINKLLDEKVVEKVEMKKHESPKKKN